MDFGLRDKIALVAASSQGLGRAVAEELAREGAHLVLCARNKATIERVAQALSNEHGIRAIGIAADLSHEGAAARVVAEGIRAFGRIDVLVTNAGGPPAGPFESHESEHWRAAVRLNLESVIELIRAVLPGMKERNWGRIINITSISVKQPVDNLILSNSIRAAVTGMARTLATEVAKFNITVNNVMPGYTRTERLVELAGDKPDAFAKWQSEIPMGRVGEPREFAALVAFLASERASYMTGTSIPVDGGWIRSIM